MCPHYRHCREQLYERSSMTGLRRHRVVKSERRAGMKNRHAVARRVAYLTRPAAVMILVITLWGPTTW